MSEPGGAPARRWPGLLVWTLVCVGYTTLEVAGVVDGLALPVPLMIFLMGVGLGLLKQRTSTTFTACVHVVYDIGAFLLPD